MNGHWAAGVGHVRLRAGAVGGGDDWGFGRKCGSCARLRRPTFVPRKELKGKGPRVSRETVGV